MRRRPTPPKAPTLAQGLSDADVAAYGERCVEYGRKLAAWEQDAADRDVVASLARAGLLDVAKVAAVREILPALEGADYLSLVVGLDDDDIDDDST